MCHVSCMQHQRVAHVLCTADCFWAGGCPFCHAPFCFMRCGVRQDLEPACQFSRGLTNWAQVYFWCTLGNRKKTPQALVHQGHNPAG